MDKRERQKLKAQKAKEKRNDANGRANSRDGFGDPVLLKRVRWQAFKIIKVF